MSTLAEIEAVVPTLSVEELAALERLIQQTREGKLREDPEASSPSSVTRTHDFGFHPAVDLTKLGQLADDL